MAKPLCGRRRKSPAKAAVKRAPSGASSVAIREQVEPALFQKQARSSSALAWKRLQALLAHEDAKIAMAAAQAILDRAWGKVGSGASSDDAPRAPLLVQVVTGIERDGVRVGPQIAAPTAASLDALDHDDFDRQSS